MSGVPPRYTRNMAMELPSAQLTLGVLNEFLASCQDKAFDEGAKIDISVDSGNAREPSFVRIKVSER